MKYLKTFESFSPINEEEIFDFLRGGSKEEIEKYKKEFEASLAELVKEFGDFSKSGKNLTTETMSEESRKKLGEFKDSNGLVVMMKNYGGNDKPVPFVKATFESWAKNNNYLGKFEVIPTDGYVTKDKKPAQIINLIWKDGKKGMNKLAAGTKDAAAGK